MKKLILTIILLITSISLSLASTQQNDITKKVDNLEKPIYTPFVENYTLHEIQRLKEENKQLRVEVYETLTKKN